MSVDVARIPGLTPVIVIEVPAFGDLPPARAGDTVLATLGRRLRQTVRDTDLVARWASDEFVLLLDGVGSEDSAEFIRDQVERVLRDTVEISPGGPVAELAGTVGVALYPDDATDPDELMRAAEADMVRRKPASVSQW